jgi:hypothetical protein
VIPDPVKVERLPGIPEGERFSRLNEFAAKFMTADDAWAVQIADEFEYPSALRVDPAKGSEYMQMARRFSDEKPTFLSRKDFIEKAKGMHPIGHFDRGVKHLNPLGELKVDKAWQGQGVYGHGYYHQLASKEKLSLADSLKGKVSGTATSYADPDRTTTARVMIGFLSKEAKVITNAQLREIRDDFTEYFFSLPQGPQGLIDFAKVVYGKESVNDLTADMIDAVKDDYAGFNKIHTAVLGLANDDGSFARLMGYDALHVEGQDFLVVVNNRHYNLLDEVAAAPKFAREGGEQYLRWRFLPPLSP